MHYPYPMPNARELILVRHGQSTANARGTWQGQMDFPLSDEGRQQARMAGLALSRETFDGLYSSPLSRAFETASIIRAHTGFRGEVVPVEGLSERSGGILEGYTWAEQEQRNPELAEKFLAIPEEDRWALVGAETDEDVIGRFGEAIASIGARHAERSRIVIVSHGGAMRAYLRELFGPEVLPGAQRAANASITRMQWDDAGPHLLELAATSHLAEDPGATTME
jgi:broad specificity phosphatase PhoE